MAAASPIQTAFNAGELSPLMAGRVDFQKYVNGCKTLQNFIPTTQGPVVNRPGFHFVAGCEDITHKNFLVPFVFSENTAFILEFGNAYIKFYTQHGQLIVGGVPYAITSPYLSSDLFNADGTPALTFTQSGDVIYIANANHPPQKLIRLSNTSWTIGNVPFTNGPFEPVNTQADVTITTSNVSGAITITASAAIFDASMVGTKFYIQYPASPPSPPWEWSSGLSIPNPNTFIRYGLNFYEALTTGTTGASAPIHTQGTQLDGSPGINWQYLSSGYAVATITGFTSGTSVSATVDPGNYVFPTSGATCTTNLWARAAWMPDSGFPTAVTFFRGRLVWAQNTQLFFSVAGDFENMATQDAGIASNDMAIVINIASDRYDAITWMASTDVLLVGTVGSEYAVAEANTAQSFGQSNVQSKQQTGNGGRSVQPIVFNSSTLFVQRAGRQLREIRYSFATNNYQSIDLTVLSEHITRGQIVAMDFQQQPNYIVWCVLATGQLVGLTYCREQDTVGWHEHSFTNGAIVESVACIPTPDGTADELWVILAIEIQGTLQRYVCYLDQGWNTDMQASSAFYVDMGSTFNGVNSSVTTLTLTDNSGSTWSFPDNGTITSSAPFFQSSFVGSNILIGSGASSVLVKLTGYTSSTVMTGVIQGPVPTAYQGHPTTNWSFLAHTISGLDYLDGVTVSILGDGAPQASQTVVSGSITLEYPAAVVQVGLPYTSTLTSMRFNGGGQTGTGQGMLKRISHCIFRFLNTLGGSYGPDGGPYDDFQFRSSFDDMNQPPPMFTGDIRAEWNSGTDYDGYVSVVQEQPLPMTVIAIMPQFFTNDPQT